MEAVQRINHRYILQDEIGSGGMGTVYQATDRLTGQQVALKQLVVPVELLEFMSMSTNSNMLLSLAHEFELAASLRHPHIVSVLDYGFSEGQYPYLVMELLQDAQPFVDYAREQSLSQQINLIVQALQALAYLHRRGVIHRDLKPENILVVDGKVKVLDFGLSVTRGQATEMEGTIAYIAPEVIKGDSATPLIDLYAMGVIAYELWAGELPFHSGDLEKFVNSIVNQPVDVSKLDVPENVTSIVARLMAKNPSDRYANAMDAMNAFSEAHGLPLQESSEVRESYLQAATFVGRSSEMTQLMTALKQAVDKQGSLWLVGGESGSGKSRLLDELRTRALVQGFQVLRGQGVSEGGLSYQLWRDVMRRLVLSTDLNDLEAGVLKEIVPNIGKLLERDIPDPPELSGQASDKRLQETIVDLLKQQEKPILLLLEDLQWSDESLEPLKPLVDNLPTLQLLVVGSYRNDEKPHLPETLPGSQTLLLDRLSSESIEELTVSMLGEGGREPHIVELLQKETEGNAFFLVEVVRALAETAGSLDDIGRMTLPRSVFAGGVQQIIRRRLDKVPETYQQLLSLAAVAGRQVDLATLNQLKGEIDIQNWLLACQEAAVLEIRDDSWRFTHDKLRETLLNDLEEDTHAKLHRQVAEVIEQLHPDDEAYDEVLLDHWRLAGDIDKELVYLSRFSRYLTRIRTNYDRAKPLIERGLSLTSDDDRQHIKFLRTMADVFFRQDDYESALHYAQQTKDLSEQYDDIESLISSLVTLSNIAVRIGEWDKALDYGKQALAIKTEQNKDQDIGLAILIHNLGYMSQGNLTESQQYYEQSLAISRSLDNTIESQRIMAGTLLNLGVGYAVQDNFYQARVCFEESLEIAKAIDNQNLISLLLHSLGNLEVQLGNDTEALAYYEESLSLTRDMGLLSKVIDNLNAIGSTILQAHPEQGLEKFKEALEIAQSIESVPRILLCVTCYAEIYMLRHQVTHATKLLGLVKNHPQRDAKDQTTWEKVASKVREKLDDDTFEAALEAGKSLNLDETVEKIIQDFPDGI